MFDVISYKNGPSCTLLLRGKSKSINYTVSKGLNVYKLVKFMRYIWVYLELK